MPKFKKTTKRLIRIDDELWHLIPWTNRERFINQSVKKAIKEYFVKDADEGVPRK